MNRLEKYINSLPESLYPDLEQRLRITRSKSNRTIIVIDDDPTGCQTVSDVPVLFYWDREILEAELRKRVPVLFLMTNSRSLSVVDAVTMYRETGHMLHVASRSARQKISIISRSVSTLRGHYPAEPASLHFLYRKTPLHCIIPAFFQGGRVTLRDTHYVKTGEEYVPAGETPFARDPVFGFRESDLRKWVIEKTSGSISSDRMLSIGLSKLREKGPSYVRKKLQQAKPGSIVIVNALQQNDLDIFALGAMKAEKKGVSILYRTAASFINSFAAIPARPVMEGPELTSDSAHGGVFIVGSYVPKSTEQLKKLLTIPSIHPLDLEVSRLFTTSADSYVTNMSKSLNRMLAEGKDVVLFTSRKLYAVDDPDENIDAGQTISSALVKIIRGMEITPSFLAAKGGITSHDVASRGLGIQRAIVAGQALPGVPVIIPDDHPEMRYIIFPGNVGDEDSLVRLYKKLRNKSI